MDESITEPLQQPPLFCSVNDVLDEHRISQLQRLARELRQLRGVCRAPGTAADCKILISADGAGGVIGTAAVTA